MANWRRSIACWLFFCECTQHTLSVWYILYVRSISTLCRLLRWTCVHRRRIEKKCGRCQHMGKSVNQTVTWHVYDCETRNTSNNNNKKLDTSRRYEIAWREESPHTQTKRRKLCLSAFKQKYIPIELNWKWFRFVKHLIYFYRFRLPHLLTNASKRSNSMRRRLSSWMTNRSRIHFNSSECFVVQCIIQINQFRCRFAIRLNAIDKRITTNWNRIEMFCSSLWDVGEKVMKKKTLVNTQIYNVMNGCHQFRVIFFGVRPSRI